MAHICEHLLLYCCSVTQAAVTCAETLVSGSNCLAAQKDYINVNIDTNKLVLKAAKCRGGRYLFHCLCDEVWLFFLYCPSHGWVTEIRPLNVTTNAPRSTDLCAAVVCGPSMLLLLDLCVGCCFHVVVSGCEVRGRVGKSNIFTGWASIIILIVWQLCI